jgi:mono/diheme cytochrome c family protein
MKIILLALVSALIPLQVFAAKLDGKSIYQENCISCHGDNAKGGSAPKLTGDASKWSRKLFQRAVLSGIDDNGKPLKSPMPHWKEVGFHNAPGKAPSLAEINAIQDYLRKIK